MQRCRTLRGVPRAHGEAPFSQPACVTPHMVTQCRVAVRRTAGAQSAQRRAPGCPCAHHTCDIERELTRWQRRDIAYHARFARRRRSAPPPGTEAGACMLNLMFSEGREIRILARRRRAPWLKLSAAGRARRGPGRPTGVEAAEPDRRLAPRPLRQCRGVSGATEPAYASVAGEGAGSGDRAAQ